MYFERIETTDPDVAKEVSHMFTVEGQSIETVGGLPITDKKAMVKIQLGQFVISDFRIVQQRGQKPWVSAPAVSWTGEDGKPSWKTLIEMPKPLKKIISEKILAGWFEYLQKENKNE